MSIKIKEGLAQIIKKGETVIILDEQGNVFHTMDMFLKHITKEKMDEVIKKSKEEKK